jgi:predicted GNAT superfamily acetyltransferase
VAARISCRTPKISLIPMDVRVQPLTRAEELRAVLDLQRTVWGMPDREVVPVHQLLAAANAGGVVLGAFAPDGTLVGFCYGFVGMREGQPLFYSHMAGVRPDWQDRDVGLALKRAQREAALARGLDRMVWTFDPLQSRNAAFNLRKLGAVAERYLVDYYGEMDDDLNRGLPSDRLEVDWWLRTPRVAARLEGRQARAEWPHAPRVLPAVSGPAGPAPGSLTVADAPAVLVDIPTDLAGLRARSPSLALAWRLAVREAFVHCLGRGYRAVDFVGRPADPVGSYVLTRAGAEEETR